MDNKEIVGSKKNRILIMIVAVVLSFLIRDAIVVFANAFLPRGEITVTVMPPDGEEEYPVEIVQEQRGKELFGYFRDAVQSNDEPAGWIYNPGNPGFAWTSVSSSTTGATLTVTCRRNPDYCLSALKSKWNRSFMYSVDGNPPISIECYDEENFGGEIVRVYPFQHNRTRFYIQLALHLLATLTFYSLIVHFFCWFREDEKKPAGESHKESNHETG